ncbi:hypothetical protein LTS10_000328 [Elasticomyces elasticus]|nr:hypothetical protein LTS10_000328 [Elasticomyces elasticus]
MNLQVAVMDERDDVAESSLRTEDTDMTTPQPSVDPFIGRCYLLELPKELRLAIYDLLVPDSLRLCSYDAPNVVGIDAHDFASTRVQRMAGDLRVCISCTTLDDYSTINEHYHVDLLRTSRQVYVEAKATFYKPRHLGLRCSAMAKDDNGGTHHVERPFPAESLHDIRILQTLTVHLLTNKRSATEDLAHSRLFIRYLHPTLKVQNFTLCLASAPALPLASQVGHFEGLKALIVAWGAAGLGTNVRVVAGSAYGKIVWTREDHGPWSREETFSRGPDDNLKTGVARLFATVTAAFASPSAAER